MEIQIKAAVVTVEYSGHDCEARLDSLHNTVDEAQARADELNRLNEEYGDESNLVVEFSIVEGTVVLRS